MQSVICTLTDHEHQANVAARQTLHHALRIMLSCLTVCACTEYAMLHCAVRIVLCILAVSDLSATAGAFAQMAGNRSDADHVLQCMGSCAAQHMLSCLIVWTYQQLPHQTG